MEPSWIEHIDLFQAVASAGVATIVWFIIRTLRQIDSNQRETAKQLAGLTQEFYQLKGEHRALACKHSSGE